MNRDWLAEVKSTEEDGSSRYILEQLPNEKFQRGYELAAQRRYLLDALRDRRREKNLSQGDLAEILGTSQSVISDIERGRKDSRLWTLLRIAEALDVYIAFDLREFNGGDRDNRRNLSSRIRDAVAVLTGEEEIDRL